MARLNVGILGLSHDHVWSNLAAVAANEHAQLVAAADPDPKLRDRLRGEHGGVDLHEAYDGLLDRGDLDAVLVFADNRTSAALGVRALQRKIPVMIEKPMAADLGGADALLGAARAGGVPLMVNWPTAWRPALRHGLRLARDGAVGEPIQLSHRGGHAGPREFGCSPQFCDWLYDSERNGGGALVDYAGHGAMLCRVVLGRPSVVTAVAAHLRKDGLAAEDNAVVVLSYPRALGLLEASWTQIGGEPAFAMIVYGDTGTLIVHQARATHESQRVGQGRVQIVRKDGTEIVEAPPLPAEEQNGPAYFFWCLRTGRDITGPCAADVGRDVQEVLTAALLSNAGGRTIRLPLVRSGQPR